MRRSRSGFVVLLALVLSSPTSVRGQAARAVASPDATVKRLVEQRTQTWAGSWLDVTRIRFLFDDSGRKSESVVEDWTGSAWEPFQRDAFAYDELGRVVESVNSMWLDGEWIAMTRFVPAYDGGGFEAGWQFDLWTGSDWIPFGRRTQTNDAGGNVLEFLEENHVGTGWVSSARGTYTYDGEGRELSFVPQTWDPDARIWLTGIRQMTSYGTDGAAVTVFQRIAVGVGWEDVQRNYETVDGLGRVIETVSQDWVEGDNVWLNLARETLSYDDAGRVVESVSFDWYGDEWRPLGRSSTGYDEHGDTTEDTYEEWDDLSKEWSATARNLYFYAPLTGVEGVGEVPVLAGVEVFPSPAASLVHVNVAAGHPGSLRAEVFDLLGRRVEILTDAGAEYRTGPLTWNTSGHPNGVYFVKVTSGVQFAVKPVVVAR